MQRRNWAALAALACVLCVASAAHTQNVVNPVRQKFSGTHRFDRVEATSFAGNAVLFAALGTTAPNGTRVYCSDCTKGSDPCSGSGTGAWADRLNGAWVCGGGVGGGSGDIQDVWGCTTGNCNALTGAAGDSLDAGSADSAKPATRSATLPGTCTEGQTHQDTDSGGTEWYICTATDTWTKAIAATDTVAAASALAADGADCSAGSAAGGVDAAGVAEVCIDPILETEMDAFGEFVTQANISGTCNATTFVRGDGQCQTPAGSGDVVGPASATDNAIARYDTTTGKLLQNSDCTIGDSANGIDCAAHATLGGAITLKEGADDGSNTWQLKIPDSGGLTATVSEVLEADGDIPTSVLATTGVDPLAVSGTAGSSGHCGQWDGNGDLVTSGAACGATSGVLLPFGNPASGNPFFGATENCECWRAFVGATITPDVLAIRVNTACEADELVFLAIYSADGATEYGECAVSADCVAGAGTADCTTTSPTQMSPGDYMFCIGFDDGTAGGATGRYNASADSSWIARNDLTTTCTAGNPPNPPVTFTIATDTNEFTPAFAIIDTP